MKKSRFAAKQMVGILTEAAGMGTPVADICRRRWITEQAHYRRRRAHGRLRGGEVKRLRALAADSRDVFLG